MNLKTIKSIFLIVIVLFTMLTIFYKYKLSVSEENARVVRALEKSHTFSHLAKLVSSQSQFESLSMEEYLYCVLKAEYNTLETGEYRKFINTEISNKNLKDVASSQFTFNLYLIKNYLDGSTVNPVCPF